MSDSKAPSKPSLAKLKQNISNRLGRPSKTAAAAIHAPQEPPTILTALAGRVATSPNDLDNILPISSPESSADFDHNLTSLLPNTQPAAHCDPRVRSLHIPKSNVRITPFQFSQACRILLQHTTNPGITGGLLANSPGTGKSYIILAALLLRALVFESKRQVEQYWAAQQGNSPPNAQQQHLPRFYNNNNHHQRRGGCPSQDPDNVVCYCVPNSLTALLADTSPTGISVLQVPTQTLSDWHAAFDAAILRPSSGSPCRVYMLTNTPPPRFRIRPSQLQTLLPTLSTQQTTANRNSTSNNKTPSPEAHVFLTSLQSVQLLIAADTVPTVGLHIADEAHQILANPSRASVMRLAETQHNCNTWFVTGTPFRNGSLAEWIPALSRISKAHTLALTAAVAEEATTTTTRRQSNNKKKQRAFAAAAFDTTLVLRHFPTSTMFGEPLTDLQAVQPTMVSRLTPDVYREAVQAVTWRVQMGMQQYPTAAALAEARQGRDRLYFLGLFPVAAQMMLAGEDAAAMFDEETIVGLVDKTPINRMRIETQPELKTLAVGIAEGSPKVKYILEEIARMLADNRRRRPQDAHAAAVQQQQQQSTRTRNQPEHPTLKKMVIVTPTIATAAMLYLALSSLRKDLSFLFYTSRATHVHRELALHRFNSTATSQPQILVTNYAAAGTGVNLQAAASYQILTSKLPTRANEIQAFARTNREGQRLPVVHKLLVCEDCPVERVLVCEQAGVQVGGDPFDRGQELEYQEPEDEAEDEEEEEEVLLQSPTSVELSHDHVWQPTPMRSLSLARTELEQLVQTPPPPPPPPSSRLPSSRLPSSSLPSSRLPLRPQRGAVSSTPQDVSPIAPKQVTSRPSRFREHLGSETSVLLGTVVNDLLDAPTPGSRKGSRFRLLRLYKKVKG